MNQHAHEPYKIFFETLSNKARWEIVHLLGGGARNATDIAQKLGYEQSLVSHHLKRLETCGFVEVTRQGRERVYALNKETIRPLLGLMDRHISQFCKDCALNLSL